jgi:hypothetical protein
VLAGRITQFDAADGLGWIELDDGRQIRFSLTHCGYMRPDVGKRVRVYGLESGFGGKLRASLLEPEEP